MKLVKSAVAALAAAGLFAAPVAAQAASVRAPSDVTDSQEVAGGNAILYLALLAFAAALIFVVADDDSMDTDGLPSSP